MRRITCIEDLPPELQEEARQHLLIYGNVFVHNTGSRLVLLPPVNVEVLVPRGYRSVNA